jgi:ribosomal protein S24E
MELHVLKTTEEEHFDRKRIEFTINTEKNETVRLDDAKKLLAEKFGEGIVIVYSLKNVYGARRINGTAHVYKDEKTAKRLLQRYILKKNGLYAEEKETKK